MNIQIAILEDKKQDYEQLATHLKKWAYTQGHIIKIYWFCNVNDILSSSQITNCQILFSDIELKTNTSNNMHTLDSNSYPVSNGIAACISLRNTGYIGEIVFLTAFKEYVFEGYDVQALNYLLKPIQESSLYKCLDKYITLHCSDYYYYHKKDNIIQIPYNNIVSISRDGHDCIIQTIDNIHIERAALKDFETRLPAQFLRCHKSCIINIFHIKSLSGTTLKLSNNQTQSVGRIYLDNVRKYLIKLANDNLNI